MNSLNRALLANTESSSCQVKPVATLCPVTFSKRLNVV